MRSVSHCGPFDGVTSVPAQFGMHRVLETDDSLLRNVSTILTERGESMKIFERHGPSGGRRWGNWVVIFGGGVWEKEEMRQLLFRIRPRKENPLDMVGS